MGLFNRTINEKGGVFIHRDDGVFSYRLLDIQDNSLCDFDSNGKMKKAFALYFKLQKEFSGYKEAKQGLVTVLYNRDIILDPFNQLVDVDKPEQGPGLIKKFTARIATAKIYIHEREQKEGWIFNKAVLFAGVTMIILALAKGIQVGLAA